MFSQTIDQKEHKNNRYKLEPATWCYKHHSSGQCILKQYWGLEGAKDDRGRAGPGYSGQESCTDSSDLYRPIKPATKVEEIGRQNYLKKEKPTITVGDRNSAEPDGGQASQTQMWKTEPKTEETYEYYKGRKEWENATKDDPSTLWFIPQTDPFKVPAITTEEFEKGPFQNNRWVGYEEKFANFFSSDNYVKDETTNLMMAPTNEENCNANNGFVCEVKL